MRKYKLPELVRVAVYERTDKEEIIKRSKRTTTIFIEENLKNENWVSLKWYRDLKKTTNNERPAYNKLIKDIFEEKVNLLIVIGTLETLSSRVKIIDKIKDNISIVCIGNKGEISFFDLGTSYLINRGNF